jgi:hypothetical protein
LTHNTHEQKRIGTTLIKNMDQKIQKCSSNLLATYQNPLSHNFEVCFIDIFKGNCSELICEFVYIKNTIIWIRGFGNYHIIPGPSTGLLVSLCQASVASDQVKK